MKQRKRLLRIKENSNPSYFKDKDILDIKRKQIENNLYELVNSIILSKREVNAFGRHIRDGINKSSLPYLSIIDHVLSTKADPNFKILVSLMVFKLEEEGVKINLDEVSVDKIVSRIAFIPYFFNFDLKKPISGFFDKLEKLDLFFGVEDSLYDILLEKIDYDKKAKSLLEIYLSHPLKKEKGEVYSLILEFVKLIILREEENKEKKLKEFIEGVNDIHEIVTKSNSLISLLIKWYFEDINLRELRDLHFIHSIIKELVEDQIENEDNEYFLVVNEDNVGYLNLLSDFSVHLSSNYYFMMNLSLVSDFLKSVKDYYEENKFVVDRNITKEVLFEVSLLFLSLCHSKEVNLEEAIRDYRSIFFRFLDKFKYFGIKEDLYILLDVFFSNIYYNDVNELIDKSRDVEEFKKRVVLMKLKKEGRFN